MIQSMVEMVKMFVVVVAVITFLLYAYFVFRILKNKKEEAPQGYVTVLLVFNIIGLILNLIALAGQDFTALISIAINGAIVAGCMIQRKHVDPPSNDVNFNSDTQ